MLSCERGGCPGALIRSFRMQLSHVAMDFSYWPHMYMVGLSGLSHADMVRRICVCQKKDGNYGR